MLQPFSKRCSHFVRAGRSPVLSAGKAALRAGGTCPAPFSTAVSVGLGRSPQGTKTRSGSGDRFAFEGFFPKISEQSEEIFCFRAEEGQGKPLAFPLRGRCRGYAVTDEVESSILTPQRQNTG